MGKNIKRLSLALIALGLSAPVFADTCNPFCVTVPNQQGGFTIGADALYLRPTAPNTSYNLTVGQISALVTPASLALSVPLTINNIDPSYHWGYDITAAYRIPCTGNDVSATWTHLGETSDTATSPTFHGLVGDDERIDIDGTSTVRFKLDSVDLDVGQKVNVGDYFLLRMFAGVRFADLQQKKDSTFVATNTDVPPEPGEPTHVTTVNLFQDSEFKGVGPQVGLDGRYCLGYGFGIDANLTGSLLVGHVDSSASLNAIDTVTTGIVTTTDFALNVPIDGKNKQRVVPALDATLGVDYTYNFNNCYRSSLVIQAGYKAINYFDVTHHILSNAGPNNATNVAFDGPYIGAKVNF